MHSLERAIAKNRKREKYRRMLNRLRLNIFEYEDAGKLAKAERVIERVKDAALPNVPVNG